MVSTPTSTQSDTRTPDWELDRDALIVRYAAYMHTLAQRWKKMYSRMEYDDLYAEIVCGFLIAAEKYDRSRKLTFPTMATWWARNRLQFLIRNEQAHGIKTPNDTSIRTISTVSIHQSCRSSSEEETLIDIPARVVDDQTHNDDILHLYKRALSAVTRKRDRKALVMRLALEHTYPKIADKFGVSRAMIHQIVCRAIREIKQREPGIAHRLS